MPTVKVLKPFRRRGDIVSPGSIVAVPDDVLHKLCGLVEVLPDPFKILGVALAEIDRAGYPWPQNFLARMPQTDRDRKADLERRMEEAALAGNLEGLVALVAEWRAFLMEWRLKHLEAPAGLERMTV